MIGEDVVEGRVRTRCDAVGFRSPPAPVDARLLRTTHGWTLVARTRPSASTLVAGWLEAQGARGVHVPEQVDGGGVVRAEFDALPAALVRVVQRLRLRALDLAPSGVAQLSLVGPRGALRDCLRTLPDAELLRCVSRVRDAPRLLTPRQEEVLTRAVAEGYYRVPRTVTLVELAEKCGVSTSSLSEILRRAEARVIARYTEVGFPGFTTVEPSSPAEPGVPEAPLHEAREGGPGLL